MSDNQQPQSATSNNPPGVPLSAPAVLPATEDWAERAASELLQYARDGRCGCEQWHQETAAIIRAHAPVTPTEQRLREALQTARSVITAFHFKTGANYADTIKHIDAALATPSGMEGGGK